MGGFSFKVYGTRRSLNVNKRDDHAHDIIPGHFGLIAVFVKPQKVS